MKYLKLFLTIIFLHGNNISIAETGKASENQSDYLYIDKITSKQAYQFTRQDVQVVKKLIHSSLAIIERKSTIYGELAILGEPFEGGENLPKKLFEPIKNSHITITHVFNEAKEGQKEIYGRYSSYIKKKYSKYWDFARISLLVDSYGQATDFLDSDFEEFDLEFKERIDPKSLSEYKKRTYASDTCHMLYRFDRIVNRDSYRFYFCVNQDNYDESATYPNKWGSLVIVRW